MKKFFLFAAALMMSVGMMAQEEGTYTTRNMSGETSNWVFKKVTAEAKIADGTEDNGLIFHSTSNGYQKLSTSGYFSNKGGSSIYFPVPSSTAEGTITLYTKTTSDSRWFQLYVNGVEGTANQRMWSKEGTDGTKKGPRSYTFTSADLTLVEGAYYLCFKDNNTELKVDSGFTIVLTSGSYGELPTDVATLKDIKVDGVSIPDFNATLFSYEVELPYGTTDVPAVTATPTQSNETVVVTPATSLTETTSITVTAGNGTTSNIYTVNWHVSETASNDATLKSLKVNGTAVEGFTPAVVEYNVELPYGSTGTPTIEYEVNEEHATAEVSPEAPLIPGDMFVTVTAQNGIDTKIYTLHITLAHAPKFVNQVVLSNGYSAWWSEGDATETIHGYYLAGQAEPTITSVLVSDGASYELTAEGLVVTGADGDVFTHPLAIEAVDPMVYTTDTITFDGTESYIKSGYGFDATKKWKFSKTDSDYSRERNGKTHIELFLPACTSVAFKESCGKTRDIQLYINGEVFGEKTNQVTNGWNTFTVNQDEAFMLSIVSAQTGGDGGIAAMVLDSEIPTGFHSAAAAVKAQKMVVNGQIIIRKDNKLFDIFGNEVK